MAERQQLVFDVLRMWLPLGLLREVGTDVKLRSAIRNTRNRVLEAGLTDVQTNPRWVVEELAKLSGTEHIVAEIEAAAEFPLGELVMPDHAEPIPTEQSVDKTLVVVTMPGLEPPPEGLDRELWGSTERYTQPLLHLAAFFTSRFIYGRNRNQRKNVFLDENHQMATWGSGRALMVRLSRDSRKWDTAVGAASQHPDDALTVGRIDALQGAAFVGRLTKQSVAEKACDLLQCPRAYAPVIQALSPKRRADTPRRPRAAVGGAGHRRVRVPGPAGPDRQGPDRHRLASRAARGAQHHARPAPACRPRRSPSRRRSSIPSCSPRSRSSRWPRRRRDA